MKVLKAKPWIGKKLSCTKCGCQFRLEKGDRVAQCCEQDDCFRDDRGRVCPIHFMVGCPGCKCRIQFEIRQSSRSIRS